jgi:branched-chain amino acid aminotransferase
MININGFQPKHPGRMVWINGQLFQPEEAKVSIFDRSFLYGEGLFETLRTYQGKPFALDEHVERLASGAKKLRISVNFPLSVIKEEIQAGLSLVSEGDSVIRIVLSQCSNPPSLLVPTPESTNRTIIIEPLIESNIKKSGLKIGLLELSPGMGSLWGLKTTSYLGSLLGMRYAQECGLDEVLWFNHDKQIMEGTTSNILMTKTHATTGHVEVKTPPDSLGILPGITRYYVERACERLGYSFYQHPIFHDDWKQADEVLLCSSLKEVASVQQIDGNLINGGQSGPHSQLLSQEFHKIVAEELHLWTWLTRNI